MILQEVEIRQSPLDWALCPARRHRATGILSARFANRCQWCQPGWDSPCVTPEVHQGRGGERASRSGPQGLVWERSDLPRATSKSSMDGSSKHSVKAASTVEAAGMPSDCLK
jgi:hypothetical protein